LPNSDKLKVVHECQLPDMVFGAKKTLYMELDFGQKNLYSPFSILHSLDNDDFALTCHQCLFPIPFCL